MEYKINDSKVIYVGKKLNYYKELIFYFKFLDETYNQLDSSYNYYKNPIFKNDNNEMFIGILEPDPKFKLILGVTYNCNFELEDLPSPNPRIRSRYYYGRLKKCIPILEDVCDLFVD